MTVTLELRAELSKVKMKRNDYPEVLSKVLSIIKNKYGDAGVSVDQKEWVAALIAEAPKDYLSSIHTQWVN